MKAKSELMREKILKAVVELFIEKGIEKVTTRDLTEYLGISRSHIYHYFKDWQSLSLAAVTIFINDELEEFRSIIQPLSASEKLQEFIDGMISNAPDPTRKLYGSLWLLSTYDEAYASLMQTFLSKWQQVLANIIQSGMDERAFRIVDAQRVARQLDAMLFGYGEHLLTLPSESLVKQAKEDIDDFIHRNILAR
ncbi:TetR/AcrR family transcriptional regulator [Enterobacter hormaechei subsp. hoffmannii]|nr:TetR/AcrR family transcriptional regulator [Enterobacter hormaechei subsp. hoffmannii]MCU2749617.1 TetR/AcrR family transcriptional regulator [Enterobacter hormaechei subsp. hoffmannii]MCU4116404.1 TetR/AcrR family transcriptional regulator [Enterobacter hormaechei subsp. hoffmannii]MCU4136344.1 TetR/AcrR family transcriptional regulator [Enterobacter hormaechei subsp. hoffmannii]